MGQEFMLMSYKNKTKLTQPSLYANFNKKTG